MEPGFPTIIFENVLQFMNAFLHKVLENKVLPIAYQI